MGPFDWMQMHPVGNRLIVSHLDCPVSQAIEHSIPLHTSQRESPRCSVRKNRGNTNTPAPLKHSTVKARTNFATYGCLEIRAGKRKNV